VPRRRPRRQNPYREINRKLDKLIQLFERLQPGDYVQLVIAMSKTTNLNIADSTIGNLAIDSQQTIGSIDQKIGALRSEGAARSVAAALATLTEAVTASPDLATPADREDLLEGIDALLEQAGQPATARKRGRVKPLIDSIANLCSSAGGLAAVWQEVGPAITGFFGF